MWQSTALGLCTGMQHVNTDGSTLHVHAACGLCVIQARCTALRQHMQELRYPGIVINTTLLVFGTAASLLAAYRARLINVNDNFRNGEDEG
jgi:hypothetical protein